MTVLLLPPETQHTLVQSPLSPEQWPFHLDFLPRASYLVGGVVRDALLGRQAEYLDLDFVMPVGSVEVARTIARHYHAGFVVLDAERQIARVVFDQATVDFALQEGDSLEQDLRRRDFTVNAIAYDPHSQSLIDPLGGYADLQDQRLRMVSAENLADDPLRLLRAYRQAAQLGFALDPDTEAATRQLSGLIRQVAAERIQSELNTLLKSDRGTPWLCRALQAQLLQPWLPAATPERAQALQRIDDLALHLRGHWPNLDWQASPAELSKAGGRSSLAIAKLITLLSPQGDRAEAELNQLKYSRAEVRAAGLVRRYQSLLSNPLPPIRDQVHLFQTLGGLLPIVAMVWLAEQVVAEPSSPARWSDRLATSTLGQLMARHLNPTDPVSHPQPLLSGKTLMVALDLKPSPQVGYLLNELQIARAEGRIANEAEAIALAKSLKDILPSYSKI